MSEWYSGSSLTISQIARWIVLSVIEGIIELILIVPVAQIVSTLQTTFKNKLWAIAVFVVRLVYVSLPFNTSDQR